ILQCIKLVQAEGADYLEVKPQAMQRFLADVTQALKGTVWRSGCRSWYQTAEGINFAIWPKSTWKYWLATRQVNKGDYELGRCARGATVATASTADSAATSPTRAPAPDGAACQPRPAASVHTVSG